MQKKNGQKEKWLQPIDGYELEFEVGEEEFYKKAVEPK